MTVSPIKQIGCSCDVLLFWTNHYNLGQSFTAINLCEKTMDSLKEEREEEELAEVEEATVTSEAAIDASEDPVHVTLTSEVIPEKQLPVAKQQLPVASPQLPGRRFNRKKFQLKKPLEKKLVLLLEISILSKF